MKGAVALDRTRTKQAPQAREEDDRAEERSESRESRAAGAFRIAVSFFKTIQAPIDICLVLEL